MRTMMGLIGMLALAGCNGDFEPMQCIDDPGAAYLSVGTGGGNTYVAGAQRDPQGPGTLLRYDGSSWTSLDVPALHDLWWVHAFDDGSAVAAGGGASILRIEGDMVTRMETPAFFGNTVFGVWGTSPDDMWAVGGWAGRAGFAWHFDGAAWRDIPLPDDLPRSATGEIPAMFKVWGRASDDVWVVGGRGTVLHWDGIAFERVPVDTDVTLFTVNGDDDEVFIVGGADTGILLRGGLEGFEDDTPEGANLLQALAVDERGHVWVGGERGFVARSPRAGRWIREEIGVEPQSFHGFGADGNGVWAAGGRVLSPELDQGVLVAPDEVETWQPPEVQPVDTACPAELVDPAPDASIARRWNEQLLSSIRRDIPHPPKHARNLYHAAATMWDVHVAYDDGPAVGLITTDEEHTGSQADLETALSHATYTVLRERYKEAIGWETSLDCYDRFMDVLGLDPTDTRTTGDDPVAVGNRIGLAVLDAFANDGSNEVNDLADTTGWEPFNPVMIVDNPGTNVDDPDVWQQLNLGTAETQNGIVLDSSVQPYIGAHWREVTPYAITRDPVTGLYSTEETGMPLAGSDALADQVLQVIRRTAELSIDDGELIDIGPGSRGNNPLGTDDGTGYDVNPVTGEPYAPNLVNRGDFARVVAEMWADGPTSETPPGHWHSLGNEVSDRLEADQLTAWGGEPVDRLTWDIGLYLAVGGAVHDAAIVAWERKRESLGARPITLVRWMAQQGQRSEPEADDYSVNGLPLEDGLVERITEESSAPGERHHHLRWHVGELAVFSWPGEPGDRQADYTPLRWMRAVDWIPYQRRTFVTPAFPGFISGHSTFSRAAAEALAAYTGSEFFPGGWHGFVAPRDGYLKFEVGPSDELQLQWATYFDAADEAGQSRLWGGIHVFADDSVGRINGSRVGLAAVERTQDLWGWSAAPVPLDQPLQ
jgi:hypothetical protein